MRIASLIAVLALVLVAPAGAARINRAERQAINRTLDGFVNSAVKRQNLGASYNLVTPYMRAGVSRSAWLKGNVPVYPYPARGTTFHGWTVEYVAPRIVGFELIVDSSKTKSDSIVFKGEVVKRHGRWLVDSFNPSATFGAGGNVVGVHDFAASSGGNGGGVARLGAVWIAVPAAVLGAGVLFLFGWLLYASLRNRRAAKRHRRPLGPPLARERREADA